MGFFAIRTGKHGLDDSKIAETAKNVSPCAIYSKQPSLVRLLIQYKSVIGDLLGIHEFFTQLLQDLIDTSCGTLLVPTRGGHLQQIQDLA